MNSTLTPSTSSRTTASPAVGAAAIGAPLGEHVWGGTQERVLNTVGNLASSSDGERWLFGPATAIASALTAVVALRTRRGTST